MAGRLSIALLRDIETLFETGTAGSLTDRQLLERFVGQRGASAEAAFEVLVLRHGPMVLRVCTNVLRDPTDAQDAFQATFLVLVERCRSIRRLESVGSWLYGVAYRVASRARLDAARRRAAQHRGSLRIIASSDGGDGGGPGDVEFGPAIQDEVRRLPEKYRAVVVLCYWQGLNHEQAAAQLGCPLGTVRSRLARARDLLGRRLARRGLAPLGGFVAVALDRASESAQASVAAARLAPVPCQLVQSAIRAAGQVAAGQSTAHVASAVVASLVQRVLWSMAMIKINSVALGVVAVGFMGYGAGLATLQARGSRPMPAGSQNEPKQTAQADRRAQSQPKVAGRLSFADESFVPAGAEGVSVVHSSILRILPDGSSVKKGQVVCELDSAGLQDRLVNQSITAESAKANFQNARLAREFADIFVVEYRDGIFQMQHQENAGDIKIAESELALAKDELSEVKNPGNNGLDVKRFELAVLRAQVGLEKAQNRQRVLVEYTKGKKIKELESEVEKARSDELAKKAIWELEISKLAKLKRQVKGCTMVAPRDGTLVYSKGRAINEGSTVHPGEALFRIVPRRQ